jgi:hypothetical protein
MGESTLTRGALLVMLAAAPALPLAARADAPKRYKCHARLERAIDHKETRVVDVTCEDGKTVSGIDGDRDYTTNPPSVKGLLAEFTAKTDGEGIALKVVATYKTTKFTEVYGVRTIVAKSEVTAKVAAGEETSSTMDVDGTPYTLTISAKPVT